MNVAEAKAVLDRWTALGTWMGEERELAAALAAMIAENERLTAQYADCCEVLTATQHVVDEQQDRIAAQDDELASVKAELVRAYGLVEDGRDRIAKLRRGVEARIARIKDAEKYSGPNGSTSFRLHELDAVLALIDQQETNHD